TRRLDFALCGIWFATAVLLSPQRMTDTLESYYAAGGPFVPPPLLRAAQQGLLALALAISGVFLVNFVGMWTQGKRPSPVKLVLLVTSISFWWYSNNIVASVLVGIALFEVFHDVQYLSLVWIYNRKRVESDRSIGGFMRFVFRRSGALVGVYVGLVLAYGGLSLSKSYVGIDAVKRILTGVVTASALLHFYYDGFIWKVREKSTRQSLGISGGTADVSTNALLPTWALHGAKWVAVFVIPLAALWFAEVHSAQGKLERLGAIVADLPASVRAHSNYATALQEAGRTDEAAGQFSAALRLNPGSAKTHVNLAALLMEKGKLDEAQTHIDLGNLLLDKGDVAEAKNHFQKASNLNPKLAQPPNYLGKVFMREGDVDHAVLQFQEALRLHPDFPEAEENLRIAKQSEMTNGHE